MQSSAMNSLKLRLKTCAHSRVVSRSGPGGVCPTSGRASVAVDDGEAAKARPLGSLPPAAEEEAGRRADASGEEEAGSERAGRDDGQVRAKLCGDVRRLADLVAELLDRVCELLALLLDVPADLLGGASVIRHRSSAPPASALPRGSPARGPAACPCSRGCVRAGRG